MIILPKELLEKLVTSEYLTLNDREQLINYIEMMEDYRIFYELYNILQAKVERLNNIINELEKWLNEEYDATIFDYQNAIEDVLDKLRELKGSGNE